jgi:hypothetical protein
MASRSAGFVPLPRPDTAAADRSGYLGTKIRAEQRKHIGVSKPKHTLAAWKTPKHINDVTGGLGSSPGVLECEMGVERDRSRCPIWMSYIVVQAISDCAF